MELNIGKRLNPQEVIAKLQEVEVRQAGGETVAQASRAISVTEQSYYCWRKEYGGLQVGQAKREREHSATACGLRSHSG